MVANGDEELNLDHTQFFHGAAIILEEAIEVLDEVSDFYEYAREILPRRRLEESEKKMLLA